MLYNILINFVSIINLAIFNNKKKVIFSYSKILLIFLKLLLNLGFIQNFFILNKRIIVYLYLIDYLQNKTKFFLKLISNNKKQIFISFLQLLTLKKKTSNIFILKNNFDINFDENLILRKQGGLLLFSIIIF